MFADRFCENFHIPPENYERAALRRSLHLWARVLRPVLALHRGYFNADREFIRAVGRISRRRQFDYEAMDFMLHPDNLRFLRRRLRLRVSVNRLRRLVYALLGEKPDEKDGGRPEPWR